MIRQRIGLLLAFLCLLLAGCGGSAFGVVPTATRTTLPTATPRPSPSATTVILPPYSTCSQALRSVTGVVQNGDLLARFTFGLASPARQLPDGLPLTPYQFSTQPPSDPAVNPNLSLPASGFDVEICNSGASASHTLTALAVSIQSYTPYAGQLNSWTPCSPIYTRQDGARGGGCGGGADLINCLQATFPANAMSGATATAALATTNCTNQALPVTLKPASDYFAHLDVTMPTAIGTYTLTLLYTVDGAAPVSIPFADPILLAPVAHDWDGQACTTSAMQSQIPTTNPTTPYICPKA